MAEKWDQNKFKLGVGKTKKERVVKSLGMVETKDDGGGGGRKTTTRGKKENDQEDQEPFDVIWLIRFV